MKWKFLLPISLLFLCVSCQNNIEDQVNEQLKGVSKMAELGTVEYTVAKIIKANDNAFYKIGDRKILFTCKATMKAGINLAKFSKDSVIVDAANKAITVKLPKPEVLALNLPAESIHLEYEKVDGLRSSFSVEDRNNLLQQGEQDIRENAESLGILKDAQTNAQLFFEALFGQLGFEKINVQFN